MRKLAILLCLALPATAFAAEKAAVDVHSEHALQGGRHDHLRSARQAEGLPAAAVLGEPRVLLLRGHAARGRPAACATTARPTPTRPRARSSRARPRSSRTARLSGFTAGRPFATESIDCKGDPQAAAKIIWNFNKSWNGDGGDSTWSYTYWDRGEQLPLYYEGTARAIGLTNRVEPEYLDENGGDIFPNEKRMNAFGIEVDAPFDARGILVLTYRYKTADGPLKQAQERRHLGVRPRPAPRAPHLVGAAHRLRAGHGLHDGRPAQLLGHSAAVRVEVHRRADGDRADQHEVARLPVHRHVQLRSRTASRTRATAGRCATRGSCASIRRTRTTRTTTRTSTSTSRPTSRSTASRTTARRSCGRSSGTTTAGARTGTAR